MSQLSRQGDSGFGSPHRLSGITEEPQSPRAEAETGHPQVIAVAKDVGVMLSGVVERERMVHVHARRAEVAYPELRIAHDLMGDEEIGAVRPALGQGEQLPREIEPGLVLAAQLVKLPEASQNREQLDRLA